MFAATKAEGTTTINNAAKEPEIINVAQFLKSMGAKISGEGTETITITGVDRLSKGQTEVIPDRIEAGTYVIIGSLIGKNLKIDNIIPKHLQALIHKLQEANANIQVGIDNITCNKNDNLKAINIVTSYYPDFPTDLQQPFSVFTTQCEGKSMIKETLYENRFMHVPYLNKMGANIKTEKDTAIIIGKTQLVGTDVVATDLRAGASLVIAGLIAEDKTIISEVEHILRGYEGIIEKLTNVGADIKIVEEIPVNS